MLLTPIQRNWLPPTGQSVEYVAGDDGTYEAGWPSNSSGRFAVATIDGDDLVYDAATGLWWAADSEKEGCGGDGVTAPGKFSWETPNAWEAGEYADDSIVIHGTSTYQNTLGGPTSNEPPHGDWTLRNDYTKGAVEYAATHLNVAGWGGFKDWRLPNVLELFSVRDIGAENGAIAEFTNFPANAYYMSSSSRQGATEAWVVNFVFTTLLIGRSVKGTALADYSDAGVMQAIRCCRGGQVNA